MIEKKKKKEGIFYFFIFLKAIKFTESAAFCRVGRVTGNNNKFLLGPIIDFGMVMQVHVPCILYSS